MKSSFTNLAVVLRFAYNYWAASTRSRRTVPTTFPEEGDPDLKLQDEKITDATATATLLAKIGDEQRKRPIAFKKIGGGWKIELPWSLSG